MSVLDKIGPRKKFRDSLTVEIEADLIREIRKEAKKRNLKIREIVEAGFKTFLEEIKK